MFPKHRGEKTHFFILKNLVSFESSSHPPLMMLQMLDWANLLLV